jgi:predicted ATPase
MTDIEGSTRLWQEHPEGMQDALSAHDRLLETAVKAAGGYVVKHTGDGIFAVFDRAEPAVAASIEVQQLFNVDGFSGVGRMAVRMAIHTGEATERQGDYFGLAASRVARLLAAGHGGQVLVSAATREVLGEAAFEFLDLGEHRFRDLTRPEHVYQLQHEGLAAGFPPLASLDSHLNNLPVQLTSFVGRDAEVGEVGRLLEEARLVTLTGVGGTGKTRLLLQVAAERASSYADGTWLVELASVTDPQLVAAQAVEPFGVLNMKTSRPLADLLADHLASKELLLLLDNCEHVIEVSSELAQLLLSRCPRLQIIATSRELLGVPGEAVFRVPPLDLDIGEPGVEAGSEAVSLFVDRARQVDSAFQLDSDNLPVVDALVRRLDGLPLAIELAASRANLFRPTQLLERLDQRFQLTTSARRDQGRHSTLETALDWSYLLISSEEQSLFRQLAVFAGGWTLEAVEAVCGKHDADPVELLGRLVDQSLVFVADTDGVNRYRLLEPVRQYALARLRDADTEEPARERHAQYFLALAEESDERLRGPDQNDWVRKVELEHDNLRAAISWSIDAGQDELALHLGAALAWFWWVRGHWNEALEWFHRIYGATPQADPVLRGRLVYKMAGLDLQRARTVDVLPFLEETRPVLETRGTPLDVAWILSRLAEAAHDPEQGVELATRSLHTFEAEGDEWGRAYALGSVGWNLWAKDLSQGFEELTQSVDALVALGDRWTAGWFGFNLGYYLAHVGRYEEGREIINRSLDLVSGTDDRWVIPHCKNRLGLIATMTDDYRQAREYLSEALPVHRQIGDVICRTRGQIAFSEVLINDGELGGVRRELEEAFEGARELHNPFLVAAGVRCAAALATAEEDHERATLLIGAVENLWEELGGSIPVHEGRRMAEATVVLSGALGRERFESLKAAGGEMSNDEAIDLALQG